MGGTITPPPPPAHQCEGRPFADGYRAGTIWTCDECGKKFVVVQGAQYNEPYTAWRALTERNRTGSDY